MKKAIAITFAVIGGVIVLLIGIGLIAGGGKPSPAAQPAAHITTTTTQPAAPAVPDPKGRYQGACSYTLGSDPVGGTAVATGDIQMHNTGNVGIVATLKITWPQQGYAPLAMAKTVHLGTGASRDVQFHRSLSQTQLDNLQNWQLGHEGSDGCTYHARITSTFGAAS